MGLSYPGLIIDEAIYGILESVDEKVDSEVEQRFVDVTRTSLLPHLFELVSDLSSSR